MRIFDIFRKPLPKESYEHPTVREKYRAIAQTVVGQLLWFRRKDYKTVAILRVEGSPTCGISRVDRWKDSAKKGR